MSVISQNDIDEMIADIAENHCEYTMDQFIADFKSTVGREPTFTEKRSFQKNVKNSSGSRSHSSSPSLFSRFTTISIDCANVVRELCPPNSSVPISFDALDRLRPSGDAVCRAVVAATADSNSGIATAFFVQLPLEAPFRGMRGLMTNNHVYGAANLVPEAWIKLEYRGRSDQVIQFKIGTDRYTFTSPSGIGLDVTYIEIKGDVPNIYNVVPVHTSLRAVKKGDDVFVSQLFGGQQLSLAQGKIVAVSGASIEHTAQTLPGSSGSMLLNADGTLVGVHHSGIRSRNVNGASGILGILEEMKADMASRCRESIRLPMKFLVNPRATDVTNTGAKLVWDNQELRSRTFFVDLEMNSGIYGVTIEADKDTGCIQFGLAVKKILDEVATHSLITCFSGACCILYGAILCSGKLQVKSNFFPCYGKKTVTLELDADRHTLHFFVNSTQIPHSVVEVPPTVYFGVSSHSKETTVELKSLIKLASPTINPFLECAQYKWK